MRSSVATAILPKPDESPVPRPQPPLAPRPPGPVDPVIGAGGTPPIIIIESPRPPGPPDPNEIHRVIHHFHA
ncbi:MAG: hypothetical protein ABWY78_08085 [Microvirga sp.]